MTESVDIIFNESNFDEILSGRSEIRNKVIARVFKEGELIE
ncbi:hypothetical protein [Sporomusa malonica]|nr:hypothetical protein [Sporomusa malonica]